MSHDIDAQHAGVVIILHFTGNGRHHHVEGQRKIGVTQVAALGGLLGLYNILDRKIKGNLAALLRGHEVLLPHDLALMLNAHGEGFARGHAVVKDDVAVEAGVRINGGRRLGLEHGEVARRLHRAEAHNMHRHSAILEEPRHLQRRGAIHVVLAVGKQHNDQVVAGLIGHHPFLNAGGEIGEQVGGSNVERFRRAAQGGLFTVRFIRLPNGTRMPEHLEAAAGQRHELHVVLGGKLIGHAVRPAKQLRFQALPPRRAVKPVQRRLCLGIQIGHHLVHLGHQGQKLFLPVINRRAQGDHQRLLGGGRLFRIQLLQRRHNILAQLVELFIVPAG